MTDYTFELFADDNHEFRWRAKHRNGNVVAACGEGYKNKFDCLESMSRFVHGASSGRILDLTVEGDK